ncbi:hypothetical protein [Rhizobium leguminosarum]
MARDDKKVEELLDRKRKTKAKVLELEKEIEKLNNDLREVGASAADVPW